MSQRRSQRRYQRRKHERPNEITAAAFAAFAENGYAATRVEDVARRAGVSKGLMYLYFKTKEELFKAVVRSVVLPRVNRLEASIESSDLSAEAFLRGPLLELMKQLPGSPVGIVVRLLIAEGPKHPDLVEYYWDKVASRGIGVLSRVLERGVEQGEFRRTAVNELPQLLIAPTLFAVIFKLLFSDKPLDINRLLETHIDMVVNYVKA